MRFQNLPRQSLGKRPWLIPRKDCLPTRPTVAGPVSKELRSAFRLRKSPSCSNRSAARFASATSARKQSWPPCKHHHDLYPCPKPRRQEIAARQTYWDLDGHNRIMPPAQVAFCSRQRKLKWSTSFWNGWKNYCCRKKLNDRCYADRFVHGSLDRRRSCERVGR
jgi:hypothetical protein